MTCQRCGSDRLFQFEPGMARAGDIGNYPRVCRSCGAIHVKGEVLELGPAGAGLEGQAKLMAEAALKAGKRAVVDLDKDPGQRIESYFARAYRTAYMDGFLRAYAFFRHEGKEGRLKRLRELWQRGHQKNPFGESPLVTVVAMDPAVYAEIDQLLLLGDPDAARRTHKRQTES